jgi:hypothetical protein
VDVLAPISQIQYQTGRLNGPLNQLTGYQQLEGNRFCRISRGGEGAGYGPIVVPGSHIGEPRKLAWLRGIAKISNEVRTRHGEARTRRRSSPTNKIKEDFLGKQQLKI